MDGIDKRICKEVREHKCLIGYDTSLMSDAYVIYVLKNDAPRTYAIFRFTNAWKIFWDVLMKTSGTEYFIKKTLDYLTQLKK